jgi:hypothetical protein
LRFAIAPASILAIRHLYRALPRAPWRPLILALAAFLLPIVNCAISPEMGLAVIASLSVYFLWFLFGPRPHRHQRLAACNLLAVLAGALAVIAWFPAGYFDSIFSFSTGGLDFPLLPALHILTMLAAAIWILPRLGSSALRGPSSPSQPFHAAWAVLLGLLLVPATGRCDVSHVFFNSLPLFLLALSALTFLRRPWSHLLLAGYFFIFPLAGQIVFWENNLPTFRNILSYRRELSRSHYLSDNAPVPGSPAPLIHSSKLLPADPWLRDLPHVPIGLPLGADEMTERYLLLASRSLPEHFIPPHTIYSPAQLERKFADLQAMPYVYVPLPCLTYLKPLDLAALAARARDDDAFLSRLLLFPANLPPVNPVFDPDAAVMRRIVRDYRVLRQFPSGYLLVRHE